jgi:hypothetical protein
MATGNSLQDIRARLQEMENKTKPSTSKSGGGDNAIYPHWKIEEGKTATLRFLPDKDQENPFFWQERQMIRLKFPGVKGGEMKPVTVQVPCMEMYGEVCPVLTEVRPWYKMNDPEMETKASQYWKKRSYIFQGFVTDNPMDEEAPANPIRRFMISPQIFNIIKSALMDPDMENMPTDFLNGTDFRVVKTSKGDYADYSTSAYSRKDRALDETELAAIQENDLYTLSDFLPSKPTAEGVQAITEMFEASVDGDLYDPERWGAFYRPYGVDAPASAATSATPAATTETTAPAATTIADDVATAEAAVEAPAEVKETVTTASDEGAKPSTEDILAMLRKRTD